MKRSTGTVPSRCTRRGFIRLQSPGTALCILKRHLLVFYLGTTYTCTNNLYFGIWQGASLTISRSYEFQENTQPCVRQEKWDPSPPPEERKLLERSPEKASSRFSSDESREFNQNVQSHRKLDFIHSSACGTASFDFFTHVRESLGSTISLFSKPRPAGWHN